jgi:hypothetical protein
MAPAKAGDMVNGKAPKSAANSIVLLCDLVGRRVQNFLCATQMLHLFDEQRIRHKGVKRGIQTRLTAN